MKSKLKCVMLVDDDRLTSFLNTILIDEAGIAKRIIRTESANKAIKYLCRCCFLGGTLPFPELVFVNLNMPKRSAWGFLESIKEISAELPLLPKIVLLTSDAKLKNISDSFNKAETGILYGNPLTSEILSNIIERCYTPTENKKE